MTSVPGGRRADLEVGLARTRTRIAAACAAAGRRAEEVTLVAVTKTWPASDCALLRDLGVHDLGENRDQEAAGKAGEVAGVRWHFLGQLQTNKARSVARYADVVHSVDRLPLVQALADGAARAQRRLTCLVQVDLEGTESAGRGGAPAAAVPELADAVAASETLLLGGLMAVAPLGEDPARAFARLTEVAVRLRADHPQADAVSAGMSGDLEEAVAAGATHVRVGSAILGLRGGRLG